MADFFGFNSTADFDHGLHDDPGGGLEEDADDYDALNDETFGADCLGGDWEQAHEELAQIENCRVRTDSYNSGNGDHVTAQDFEDEIGLEDLDLEASISQLVDDYEDTPATETKLKNKNHRPGVIQLGYSCSPPSEFNVWAVGKHDQVHQQEMHKSLNQSCQLLPTTKKIHTLEELERGLRSQARPGPRLEALAGPPRPPAALRLEDVERDLTKNKLPPGFTNRSHPPPPQYPHHNIQDLISNRNVHNGFHGPQHHHPGLRGPNYGPILLPVDFPHHPHHRHMGPNPNMLRFLPPHMMLGAQQQMRNNMAFRPPYPMPGPGFRPPYPHPGPHMRGPHPRGPPPGHMALRGPQQRGPDDYDGLMSDREIQWLLNIQLLQLNTSQPFQDDFYYTVYQSRKPKNRTESRNGRERRDSQSQLGQQQRTYTPLQFENSLGKLQVGSVTAPRKIIDMDVVSEPSDASPANPAAVQKDSRRAKQLLLQLEQLYLLLLQLEDSDNPLADRRDCLLDKPTLVQKIIGPLLSEDKLQAALCIRKGKYLLIRLLPYLSCHGARRQQLEVYACLLRHLVAIGRRDVESDCLASLREPLAAWLSDAASEEVSALVRALRVTNAARNLLVYALANKFGISALASIVHRGEELISSGGATPSPDWSVFVDELLDASSLVDRENAATPLVGVRDEELSRFLARFEPAEPAKRDSLAKLLTGN